MCDHKVILSPQYSASKSVTTASATRCSKARNCHPARRDMSLLRPVGYAPADHDERTEKGQIGIAIRHGCLSLDLSRPYAPSPGTRTIRREDNAGAAPPGPAQSPANRNSRRRYQPDFRRVAGWGYVGERRDGQNASAQVARIGNDGIPIRTESGFSMAVVSAAPACALIVMTALAALSTRISGAFSKTSQEKWLRAGAYGTAGAPSPCPETCAAAASSPKAGARKAG